MLGLEGLPEPGEERRAGGAPRARAVSGLLERFEPELRYDTHEGFFADHPSGFVDSPAVVLRCGGSLDGQPVGLDDLTAKAYRDGAGCDGADHLADADRDYRAQARAVHDDPRLRDVVFGRVRDGADGRRWLQYWFWYLYNDAGLGGRFGLHEGDWEMIQLRLAEGGEEPDLAVYAQHAYSESRPWRRVERADGTGAPIVYPARGTHASYFERGVHRTEAWWDVADGAGARVRPALEVVAEPPPGWLLWPGRWGDTHPRVPGLDSWSPHGPGHHAQWDDPARLLTVARGHERRGAVATRDVRVRRDGAGLRLDFDFRDAPAGGSAPDRLVVTIARPGGDATPVTETLVVDTLACGSVHLRRRLDPQARYEVSVSTIAGDGVPTAPGPPIAIGENDGVRAWPVLGALLGALDRAWNRTGRPRR